MKGLVMNDWNAAIDEVLKLVVNHDDGSPDWNRAHECLADDIRTLKQGDFYDVVPRSRLNAVEAELAEAKAKILEVQENAWGLIEEFQKKWDEFAPFGKAIAGTIRPLPIDEQSKLRDGEVWDRPGHEPLVWSHATGKWEKK